MKGKTSEKNHQAFGYLLACHVTDDLFDTQMLAAMLLLCCNLIVFM